MLRARCARSPDCANSGTTAKQWFYKAIWPMLGATHSQAAGNTSMGDRPHVLELNDRAQHLFKLLVERYIADGHPVGSRTLARERQF